MSQSQALSTGTCGGTGVGKPGLGKAALDCDTRAQDLLLALSLSSCKALGRSPPPEKLSFLLLIIIIVR